MQLGNNASGNVFIYLAGGGPTSIYHPFTIHTLITLGWPRSMPHSFMTFHPCSRCLRIIPLANYLSTAVCSSSAGHPDISKTLAFLSDSVWWWSLRKDAYIRACRYLPRKGSFHSWPAFTTTCLWKSVVSSLNGFYCSFTCIWEQDYPRVMVDNFTKMIHFHGKNCQSSWCSGKKKFKPQNFSYLIFGRPSVLIWESTKLSLPHISCKKMGKLATQIRP